MHIKEMHYDFKTKLNKIDSQAYRNLLVPEIDWKLNEAMNIIIKAIAQPRFAKQVQKSGYEINQRTSEDLRTIVVDQFFESNDCLNVALISGNKYQASFPNTYLYFLRAYVMATKGDCVGRLRTFQKSRGDMHEESKLENSSFEWREVNIETKSSGFIIYTDGTFTPTQFCLSYLRKPLFMHNAQDHPGGAGYLKPDGATLLTGIQNCELPEVIHSEVVDLAVLITTGDLKIPGYEIAANKLKINEG